MKKLLLILGLLLFAIPAYSAIMPVESITAISTTTPQNPIKIHVMKDCRLGDTELKSRYIIEGKMVYVEDPKRLKRDASFTFQPLKYTDLNRKTYEFKAKYIGEYTPKFEVNVGQVTKSVALSVGNKAVKGLKTGYYAVEGAVENKDGNRIKSAAENVYENSLFSYVEKGGQLHIEPKTKFGINFEECTIEEQ